MIKAFAKWRSTSAPTRSFGGATWAIVSFALSLIAMVWFSSGQRLDAERNNLQRDLMLKPANLALALDQYVQRTASELDRILLFLRTSYERSDGRVEWKDLIREDFTINEQSVQIAVIDKNGRMLTSTAMLSPTTPVDLSDREHYRFHANTSVDQLFIGKPLIGRASGKLSVQFARRLSERDGSFGGVIVVSFDPTQITKNYSALNLGTGGGIALVGIDGIVRAGTGRFAKSIGWGYRVGEPVSAREEIVAGAEVAIERFEDGDKLVSSRRVQGYPLEVVVVTASLEDAEVWVRTKGAYLLGLALSTSLILLAMTGAIYAQLQFETKLMRVARNDALTGLPNRLSFEDSLVAAVKSAGGQCGAALLIIDLDGFKKVNDTHGHPMGDKLLKAVGLRLLSTLRTSDFIARLGGDEFAVILRNQDQPSNAEAVAARICREIRQPYLIDGVRLEIGTSIGIAFASRDAKTAADLVTAADLALYCAKIDGAGSFRHYHEDLSETARARRALEIDLRSALTSDQLQLYYQPITSLPSRHVVGYEALLRWRHATRGFVSPGEFIPMAEEIGLIETIGTWVLRKACQDAAIWRPGLKVAVNCSPIQLNGGAFPAVVASALKESGLDPDRLDIEITESTLMRNNADTLRQIKEIRALGVKFSMDDFGTGYSSLSYLQSYPIDCIKIDQSFVQSLDGDESAIAIVRAIISLANALGMRTVGEGVETPEQLNRLIELGCSEAQGYYLGRPEPLPLNAQHPSRDEADVAAAAVSLPVVMGTAKSQPFMTSDEPLATRVDLELMCDL